MTTLFSDVEQSRRVLPGIGSAEWVPMLVHPTADESTAHAAFIAALHHIEMPNDLD